eukprot:SAG11_NODE_25481_length_358_cov_0.861004_1_plen_45_part_01
MDAVHCSATETTEEAMEALQHSAALFYDGAPVVSASLQFADLLPA